MYPLINIWCDHPADRLATPGHGRPTWVRTKQGDVVVSERLGGSPRGPPIGVHRPHLARSAPRPRAPPNLLFFIPLVFLYRYEKTIITGKCKYTITGSNKSVYYDRDTVVGNSRYFLIMIDCLKIRKTRREHHISMCRRSELSEWKKTRITSCARVILH
jgi:hypothetical protein